MEINAAIQVQLALLSERCPALCPSIFPSYLCPIELDGICQNSALQEELCKHLGLDARGTHSVYSPASLNFEKREFNIIDIKVACDTMGACLKCLFLSV